MCMKFTNDTSKQVPRECSRLLEKGPDFRAPPILNKKFIDNVELSLDKLTYKLRWNNLLPHSSLNNKRLVIPFDRNTVSFPKHLDKVSENKLNAFKYEVMTVVKEEVDFTKKSKPYKDVQWQIKETKKFIKNEDLVLVPTDKSKRLCLTDKHAYVSHTSNLLEDIRYYRHRDVSKCRQIERQANAIIRSSLKNALSKSDLERLLVSGTEPAAFNTFVKDHKTPSNGAYPMRPIASAKNTPTEKIDWICSKILNQLLKFIPAHLSSTDELLNDVRSLHNLNNTDVFISLDVISLYQNVPLETALNEVCDFASNYWSLIDNYNLTLEDFDKCIRFITYNYEITFNDKVYLQVGGVPMGTHYAPPFAVIFMNFIESKALTALRNKFYINPLYYKRFIDDVIMGPFPKDFEHFEEILNAFNSINDNIKFTIEIPQKYLNFLDVTLWIDEGSVHFKHYSKEINSGNCLNRTSWVPQHIKSNFIESSFNTAKRRCSTEVYKKEAIDKIKKKLNDNGYSNREFNGKSKNKKRSHKQRNTRVCNLSLPFVSNSLNRKINFLIRKYDLNVRVINNSSKKLKDVFSLSKSKKRHENCEVCDAMPNEYDCSMSNVVYEFVCRKCDGSYIGKTCRSFRARYLEHKRSIRNRDDKSALSVHVRECECEGMTDFDVNILESGKRALDIALLEARLIRSRRPVLNRCDELSEW